jgi:predicted amino acid-binding ACT domain protein
LSKAKKGFLVQGTDRIGAVHRQLARLASRKVNVVAADAVAAGQGRFGMILWVRPKDYARAARALGAR